MSSKAENWLRRNGITSLNPDALDTILYPKHMKNLFRTNGFSRFKL